MDKGANCIKMKSCKFYKKSGEFCTLNVGGNLIFLKKILFIYS